MTTAGTAANSKTWHAVEASEALVALATSAEGLSSEEAARRLATYGPNRLPQAPRRGALRRLLVQFDNLLIYVLMAAAVVSLLLDHRVDALVILGVVLLNAAIGFIQEGRAEEALEAIRSMIDPKAAVLRDGHRLTMAAEQLAPGDIVLIEAGDRVPADLRLIRARNLRIEEAVLTGESVAAEKSVEAAAADATLGDRASMAYSGTFVTAGQGIGIAVATGPATELGRISALLGTVEMLKTPLILQMDGFAKQVTAVTLGVSVLAFLFAYLARGYALGDAFMTVVGLAVPSQTTFSTKACPSI